MESVIDLICCMTASFSMFRVSVVILHKEQSSSTRHIILCLTIFKVLDIDTSIK